MLSMPVAMVDTLKTGYPHIEALSQDKEQGMHPRDATYAVAFDHSSLQKRWLWRHHVSHSPGPRLLAEVSSGTATCPVAPHLASLLR
jgi:hypothetical protein